MVVQPTENEHQQGRRSRAVAEHDADRESPAITLSGLAAETACYTALSGKQSSKTQRAR